MNKKTAEELLNHYLAGGRDLNETVESLRRAHDRLLPYPERPLEAVALEVLEFERAMRRGPQWRCTGCGWLYPGGYRDTAVECPDCKSAAGVTRCSFQRVVDWPPSVAGRERDWVLAVAARLGLEWQKQDGSISPEPKTNETNDSKTTHRNDGI